MPSLRAERALNFFSEYGQGEADDETGDARRAGAPPPPPPQLRFRAGVDDAEAVLGSDSFEVLNEVGKAMQRTSLLLDPLAQE